VGALGRLCELLRVAEEDEVGGCTADREGVRQRQLAGLVDDEHVERCPQVLAGEEPGRAGDDVDLTGVEGVDDLGVALGEHHAARGAHLVSVALLDGADRHPGALGALAHGGEQVRDGGVAVGGDADPAPGRPPGRRRRRRRCGSCPSQVVPAPGGTTRQLGDEAHERRADVLAGRAQRAGARPPSWGLAQEQAPRRPPRARCCEPVCGDVGGQRQSAVRIGLLSTAAVAPAPRVRRR
jgi:hypothetical protein